jgi:molecular chaperone DnaK (HSP70)
MSYTEPEEYSGIQSQFSDLHIAEGGDQLIIGLDFGTTYSGISYIFTGSGEADPHSIREWPGEDRDPPKTPTLVKYSKDKKTFIWGAKVDRTDVERVEGIKLLLDPSQQTPLFVPQGSNTKKVLANLPKSPMDIASDYIDVLYKHALEHIENAFFKDYVAMQQKKFVLTVPAVWSDKAKDATLRVGFPFLQI